MGTAGTCYPGRARRDRLCSHGPVRRGSGRGPAPRPRRRGRIADLLLEPERPEGRQPPWRAGTAGRQLARCREHVGGAPRASGDGTGEDGRARRLADRPHIHGVEALVRAQLGARLAQRAGDALAPAAQAHVLRHVNRARAISAIGSRLDLPRLTRPVPCLRRGRGPRRTLSRPDAWPRPESPSSSHRARCLQHRSPSRARSEGCASHTMTFRSLDPSDQVDRRPAVVPEELAGRRHRLAERTGDRVREADRP